MSRVVVISQLPPPIHGSTIMTRTFLQTLDDLNHDWLLVDRRFSKSVTEVGKLSLRKLVSAVWMPGRLLKALWRFRPDVVVFFATDRTFSFIVDWALSELMRCFSVRQINYLHTIGFETLAERSRVFGWMVSRLLRSADTTVCLGTVLASDVSRWVDESRITFIPNTVTDRPEDLPEREQGTPPVVLYLSNLLPGKGAATFVDIAIELAPEFAEVTFIVAGATADQAFTESLKDTVQSAGLTSRVKFPGAIVEPREKWELVRDAALLVFPSTYVETFGLVLAEALASGTPVASYRTGALAPAIESASAGAVVDVGDSESLKRVVRTLLSDKTILADMSQNARDLYQREYAPAVFRDRWGSLLSQTNVTE